jgi:alpha/beta hydrolase fold
VRLHYYTLGKPVKDASGRTTNAVLILHGTGGSGGGFFRPFFAGQLFNAGQLLDANKYFIILPDNIGHGKSSKPSDGLHARFPQYEYADMVALQHELLQKGAWREPPAPDPRYFHGVHAFLGVGRNLRRLYGRADATGVPAGADCRPQPRLAKNGD